MSENIGGISLDEILAAASFDDAGSEETDTVSNENSNTYKDNDSTEDAIGGIALSEILASASLDDEPKVPVAVTPKAEVVVSTMDDTISLTNIGIPKDLVEVKYNGNVDSIHTDNKKDVVVVDDPNDDIAKAEKKAEILATLRKFYMFDFLYRTAKARNWGLIVWLFINFALMEVISIFLLGQENLLIGIIIGPLIYSISLMIALSPVGEFCLRQQNSCRKIKNKKIMEKVQPIFDKVYSEAREKNPNISPKVKLFMCDEESENAFATGRRTICITKGLTNMSEEHIAGILAHEFGHLANKDTDNLLIVCVGNFFVTAITSFLGLYFNLVGIIGDILTPDDEIPFFRIFSRVFKFIFVTAFMFVWTKIGTLLCLRGNKKAEFAADMYAAELGYAQELVDAFNELDNSPAPKGLWAALTSSHPQTADRVMKLNEYIESHQQNALN